MIVFFFFFSFFFWQHFKRQSRRVNETTSNEQDVLKILHRETDYHAFHCYCNFQFDCFLFNLFKKKKKKREIDLLDFIVVVIFKSC